MRLIKMFGIAAIAAIAMMAAVGVSIATATSTVFCKVNQLVCPPGEEYTGHTEGLATNPVFLTSVGNVECEHSVILGNTLGLANPLTVHIELIDFTGKCHLGITNCSTATKTVGTILLLKVGTNEGITESHGNSWLINCPGILHCVYGGLFKFEALGYSDANEGLGTIHTNAVALPKISGLLCPEITRWDALYKIILPHKFYIAE
jgi:hypothetical protein